MLYGTLGFQNHLGRTSLLARGMVKLWRVSNITPVEVEEKSIEMLRILTSDYSLR